MKRFFVAALLLATVAEAGDFTLSIDGTETEIAIETPTTIKLPNGTEAKVTLKRKANITFNRAGISFEHPGSMGVTTSDLGDGDTQHVLLTGTGTGIFVQEFSAEMPSDYPTTLKDKLTEEAVAKKLPVNVEETEIKRTALPPLKVLKASYTDNASDDVTIIIAMSIKNGKTFVAISQYDKKSNPQEQPIVDRFWETLKFE